MLGNSTRSPISGIHIIFLEYPHTDSLILNKLAGPMPAARNGMVAVTDAPGLGVEIDTDLFEHLSDASTT